MNIQQPFVSFAEAEAFALGTPVITHEPNRLSVLDNINRNIENTPSPRSTGLQPATFADLIGLAPSFNKDSAVLTDSSQTVSNGTIPSPECSPSPLSDIAITAANLPPPLSTTLQSQCNPVPFIPSDGDVFPVETESQNNEGELTEVTVPTSGEEAMEALDPRQYQLEMLGKAVAGNVIAVLETGSGKTLIAVMLIREIVAKERLERMERRMTKLSIFLVDRVPLVFQQAAVIKANCDAEVDEFCGEMGVDLWGEKQWRRILAEKDVLVMTAQILLNMLRHGFISLDRINLLVFDECHHARRKHSYNCIMREFYDRCPTEERPKIFGMTASPMNSNKSGVKYMASHLEKALDAQIFTVSKDDESLRQFIKRPNEIAVEYDQTPKYEQTLLQTALWAECATASRLVRAFSITSQALGTLGPWCADRLWRFALQEVDKRLDIHFGELDDADLLREEEDVLLKRATEIINATPTLRPCVDNTELFAPKVRKLVQILQFYNKRPEDLCGIVFVERRHTANVLEALIGELKEELGNIKCEMLIGHGSSEDGDISMKYTEQIKVIERFKKGEINLMIATNVAEEGLDIQTCNVVIRFDFFHTLIAYIQSRGRARRPGSKYIVMVEKGNGRELKMLDDVRRMEEEMKRWCEALPADRKAALLAGSDSDDEVDSDDDDYFDPDQSYLIPATRAIVTLNSSVSLVHYYCAALPRDSFCILQPQFDVKPEGNGYICHLTLPSNSAIREVTSELLRSKGMAKRAAALKACIQLHQSKALNDHLLPDVETPEEEYRDEKGLLEGSKKRKSHYPKKIPDFWALPEENSVMSLRTLYMTMFKVNLTDDMYEGQEYRTLCLLTRNRFPPIPSFKVYFRSVERTADIVSLMPISLDDDQLDALYKFTMKMCSSIVNRDFVCSLEEIPFLVAPLLPKGQAAADKDNGQLIDWAEIRMGTENHNLPVDPNDLTDAIIIDHADNQRRYFVQRVRRDLNPLSTVPEGVQLRESGYKNFADYYKTAFGLELTLADQPLIEVQLISKVRNFLQPVPGAAPKQRARVATFVIPEYCRRFPICASVFRSAMMLPSLLMRVDAFLAMQELRLAHKLYIDDRLLLEAFTTPSANMEMNYERLETLGDSFLKFVVTIRLYILFPDKHEGQLHSARIRIICNRALYKSAKELRLFERVLSTPFNRRLWRPPRFTTKIDDKPEMQETLRAMREHGLSDKTLADVVEASLGAAYLTGGVESGLECCVAMQVPFDQITTWAHFNEVYIADRHKRPVRADPKALRTLSVARVEEITGHHFANPLLIAEALTHASLPNSTCPCYQRLEFLGDAVLDFLVIRYLFHKYPVAVPGVMTELKDASVNNQILGAICLHVGLHRHVIHFSAKLVGAITQFATVVAEMRKRGECTGEYWSELDVPKVLSDVVESMLGAVFVDSGFQIEAVQQVFAKWVQPMLDNHVTPETLKVHPLKTLTTRIQQNGCEGLLLRNHTTQATDSESQSCTIFIHDHPVTRASSNNIRTARKLAAAQANTILDEKPEYLKSVCNCALTRKHRDEDDSGDEDRDGGVGG